VKRDAKTRKLHVPFGTCLRQNTYYQMKEMTPIHLVSCAEPHSSLLHPFSMALEALDRGRRELFNAPKFML